MTTRGKQKPLEEVSNREPKDVLSQIAITKIFRLYIDGKMKQNKMNVSEVIQISSGESDITNPQKERLTNRC